MAYLAIARKWRPQRFEDIVGQGHVTRTLQNAISLGRVHHAFLFTGARGVGKTTAARILAKSLNCEKGPTATPCNECRACKEITTGNNSDVQEIDAASNTGVDSIRELRDNIRYLPSSGKYKIYIIDEVHMLSVAAFNALLKTLEEPPPHVVFIFATTDPQKVPDTILSRCQRFDFKRIPLKQIAEKLQEISSKEGVQVTEASLLMISREADGSMRDAQSLLDQVISSAGASLTDDEVVEILGLIDRRLIYECVSGLLEQSPERALATVDHIYGFGFDMKVFARELLEVVRNLNVVKVASQSERFVDVSAEELVLLRELAGKTAPDVLSRIFSLMLEGFDQVARSEAPRLALEMTLLRMAQVRPVQPVDELILRLAALEASVKGGRGGSGGGPGGGSGGGSGGAGGPGAGPGSGPGAGGGRFGGSNPFGQRSAEDTASPAGMEMSGGETALSRPAVAATPVPTPPSGAAGPSPGGGGAPSGAAGASSATGASGFASRYANRPGAGNPSPSFAGQTSSSGAASGPTGATSGAARPNFGAGPASQPGSGSSSSFGNNPGNSPGNNAGNNAGNSNRPPVSFNRPEGPGPDRARGPETGRAGQESESNNALVRSSVGSLATRNTAVVTLTLRELATDETRKIIASAGRWVEFVRAWNEKTGIRLKPNYLKHACPVREDAEKILLGFRNNLTFSKAEAEASDPETQGQVQAFFGRPVRLECRLLGEADTASPSYLDWEQARELIRRSELVQKELADPRLKLAQSLFQLDLQELRFEFERARP